MIIVTTIVVFFVSTGVPLYNNFFEKNQINEAAEQMASILKMAREMSIVRENNASYGIYFNKVSNPNKYVLFKGTSYMTRETSFDRNYLFNNNLVFDSVPLSAETIFSRGTGQPNATSTIIIKNNNGDRKIVVGDHGQIYVDYGN